MQILARVSVAAGLLAMTGVGAWVLAHRSDDAGAPQLVAPAVDDDPLTAIATDDAPPEEPAVIVEEPGDATWMPPGYVEKISRDKTEELAAFVEDWITQDNAAGPAIEYRRGIVYVESEEDRGDDGPYPKSAQAEGKRVCGSEAVWLLEYLRQRIKQGGQGALSCAGNVCTYYGMEYAPTGNLVFKEIDDRWTLIAWTQVYEAALTEDVADANIRSVIANMIKLRDTRCAGEPAGFYY